MPDSDEKAGHLVVYDYGSGGHWAYLFARSKEDIAAKYPKLKIADERPKWMSDETYDLITSVNAFDIDDEPPEWLKLAMDEPT